MEIEVEREKDVELHEEQCQSELPWRKDCVEEIQEMTSVKLMSVSEGNCSLPSIRIEMNVELNGLLSAIVFTSRVSAKARFLKQKISRTSREKRTQGHRRLAWGYFLRNTVAAQVEQTAEVPSRQCDPRANFNDLETVFLLKAISENPVEVRLGEGFHIGNADSLTEKKEYSSLCMWMA